MAYSVHSHGFNNHIFYHYTDTVRFSPSSFAAATSYVRANRTVLPDLVPLDVQESVPYAARGTWVRDSEVLVHNHSDNAYSGSLIGYVYLSRDRQITSADTYVGYMWQSVSIPGMTSRQVSFDFYINPVSIPRGGLYYIGVDLRSHDGNRNNNVTGIYDVGQIIAY